MATASEKQVSYLQSLARQTALRPVKLPGATSQQAAGFWADAERRLSAKIADGSLTSQQASRLIDAWQLGDSGGLFSAGLVTAEDVPAMLAANPARPEKITYSVIQVAQDGREETLGVVEALDAESALAEARSLVDVPAGYTLQAKVSA